MMKKLFFIVAGIILISNSLSFAQMPIVINCHDCKITLFPKPEYPNAARAVKASGKVGVEILIDEKGNVVEAKAVSGHPLLWAEAVKAAYKAKFEPKTLSGKPVKLRTVIVYNFIPDESNQSKKDEEKIIKGGIVNSKATYLPQPEYSQEAKDFCASGKVKVKVLIGEDGNVISAEAISGDEFLRNSSAEAAKKAKFAASNIRLKVEGIIVYDFVPEKKCVEAGIVNKKAISLPKPVLDSHIKATGIVEVRAVIDESGKVVLAKAISGHPLLFAYAETAARNAKFDPTNDFGKIRINALLIYKFNSDRTVETDFPKDKIKKKP